LAKKHVVLLSPQEDVPKDLETDIAVVDFELPDRECLDGVVQDCLNVYPKADALTVNSDTTLRSRLVEAGLGLSRSEFENVLARSLARCKDLDLEVVNEEKEAIIRRNGILEFYRPKETTDDIGGLGDLVSWLSKRGSAFGKKAREYGLPAPKGVLIVGIPGTGKSLTAKAVGNLWKLPLLRLDMGKVFGSLVGESEANIRKVIQTAEAVAPCVMWIDEMEKALSGTGSSGDTDSGVTARVFGSVLTWLSEKESPVFVVATANDISSLPPELLRKGRLDEIFFVDLPDSAVRDEIFRIHLAKKGRDVDRFNVSELASASDGFSGAEIEQAVISALYDSFDDEERELTTADILKSIKETVPLSTTMRTNIEAMRDWAKNRARMAQASRGGVSEPQSGTRFDVT
jgi:SpoVK/Ycf46/Vps4 family AAA+-type ATPase